MHEKWLLRYKNKTKRSIFHLISILKLKMTTTQYFTDDFPSNWLQERNHLTHDLISVVSLMWLGQIYRLHYWTKIGACCNSSDEMPENLTISDYFCDKTLQWRHNELDGVSNHRRFSCLLNRLLSLRSKKTSKLRVTGLCEGNSPVTGENPALEASNKKNVSIWWRYHDLTVSQLRVLVSIYERL